MIRGSAVALCLLLALSACRGYDYQSRISKPDGFVPGDQMARYGREQAQSVAIARAFAAARAGDSPDALSAWAASAPGESPARAAAKARAMATDWACSRP